MYVLTSHLTNGMQGCIVQMNIYEEDIVPNLKWLTCNLNWDDYFLKLALVVKAIDSYDDFELQMQPSEYLTAVDPGQWCVCVCTIIVRYIISCRFFCTGEGQFLVT